MPPTSLHIRDVLVTPNLVLAPMEGVTDLPFRRMIRGIGGCGLTWTEFVPASQLAAENRRALAMLATDPDERPFGIQVYGREPAILADAARMAQDHGADIVDLNMGCPSKKVCAHSGGSSLMREPLLAARILRAMRAAITIPLTVKMRSGWDAGSRNAPELSELCVSEGVEAITVHWRTRADLYGGERRLDTIAEVVDRVRVPVLANGDVVDAPSALDTLRQTGAAGLVIGRGAVRDPWVFRTIEAALHGQPAPVVTQARRVALLHEFLDALRARFPSDHAVLGRFKKISKYFTEGLDDDGALRTSILRGQSLAEVEAHVLGWRDRNPVCAPHAHG